MPKQTEFDVAIVGCGPVGAVMANLLGQVGLHVVVFEIGSSVYHLPRAAHFDAEIMRVFQAVGLADAVLPSTRPLKGMDFINGEGTKLFGFAADDGDTRQGWPQGYMFYQPDLEVALRRGLDRFANVDVRYEHEVTGFDQDDDGVAIRVRNIGEDREDLVRARYLLGADGGRSTVRKLAGIELEDLGFDQPWLVVDTMLKRDVQLPEVALQICDPERPSTFIPSAGKHRRWEFMLMPGESAAEMERDGRAQELVRPWIAPDDAEVTRAVVYTFHALIAKQWRNKRVILVGDAAHQMPPFLGQGMCSGIRDAHNLAWKLRMVLAGTADDVLLDTYQRERAPHVRTIIERAVGFGRIIQTTDPAVAAARDAQFLSQRAAPDGGTPFEGAQMPTLGEGILSRSPAAGEMSPQPLVRDVEGRDRRLDDLTRSGFAILGPATESLALAHAATAIADATGIEATAVAFGEIAQDGDGTTTVVELSTMMRGWIAEHGITIVRPDRYAFGTTTDGASLPAMVKDLEARATGVNRGN